MPLDCRTPGVDKIVMRAAFDHAANSYDAIADFQHRVGERLAAWLMERRALIAADARMLDAGCGTGYGAALLRRWRPQSKIFGCDAAFQMTQHTAMRAVITACADIEQLPFAEASFDLCWTSLALQWCRLPQAFGELRRVLSRRGILIFSTLGPGTLHELAHAFSGVDGYRRFLSFPPMSAVETALNTAGFSDVQLVNETWITRHPDLKSLLSTIRGIGAHRVGGDRRTALMGKNAWQTMASRYEALREGGWLPASYDVILGFARKSG